MYKKSVQLRPLYIQSVKIAPRWGNTLLLLLTLALEPLGERDSNQKVSPPINIKLTNLYKQKTPTMLNHWTDSGTQSSREDELEPRLNLEAWRSKIFQVYSTSNDYLSIFTSLPLQHMRLHPLYHEGQCQWSGCQAECHNLWEFLHHLKNDHKVRRLC